MKTFKQFISEDRVDEGLVSLLVKGAKAAAPYVMPAVRRGIGAIENVATKVNKSIAPEVNNRLGAVPKQSSLLGGRAPAPRQVTHLQRNMHPDELANANKTGYFQPRPKEMKVNWDKGGEGNSKWWSRSDDSGQFGRPFQSGPNKPTVRVPRSDFSANKAIPVNKAEVNVNGQWVPAIDKSMGARASRTLYKAGRVLGINEDV